MRYRQDISACLATAIGDRGLSETGLQAALADAQAALDSLRKDIKGGRLPAFTVAREGADLTNLRNAAEGFRGSCDEIAILGTGGSSLGGQALYALARDAAAPRVQFFDNIDPDTLDSFSGRAPDGRTGFIVISKSGSTAETLAQALTLLPQIAAAGGDLSTQALIVTEPGERPLRALAAEWGCPVLDHDPKIGGRFAVMSVVGALPALVAGVDVSAVRAGAAAVLAQALSSAAADVPAAVGAALAVALQRDKGAGISVLMAYSDRLWKFAQWYQQLWAESLGKGGGGTTPVAAMGAVDQHSQLQLYLDGPPDKMFTVIAPRHTGSGQTVDTARAKRAGIEYLAGRTVGDLMAAEQQATIDALVARQRPTRVFEIDTVDEATLGALMMHFMLETVIAAHMLGVDPFDQPAVEDGKKRARSYLMAMS